MVTQESRLAFCSSSTAQELWPSLIEKAYAKIHGGYWALQRGSVAEALAALTGGVVTKVDVTNEQHGAHGGEHGSHFRWCVMEQRHMHKNMHVYDSTASVLPVQALEVTANWNVLYTASAAQHALKCRYCSKLCPTTGLLYWCLSCLVHTGYTNTPVLPVV